jgi:putative toxin-antitoxin system antitoxin component (TIGR02293 family)
LPGPAYWVILNRQLTETAMTTIERTLAYLGGAKVLGKDVVSDLTLADAVTSGLPSRSLEAMLVRLHGGSIARKHVYQVVGSERTLQKKQKAKSRLSAAESDKLARLARVAAQAEDLIGDQARAHRWLGRPNRALDGKAPVELLGSDAGAILVVQVLERIAHGVVG